MNISVHQLAETVTRELAAYSQEITDGIKRDVKRTADECRDELRETSPNNTGSYQKGWRVKQSHESRQDIRVTVHNKTDYQLTHLLEHGHAKATGGRVEGIPHIRPAEQHAEEKLLQRARVTIRR